MPRGKSTKIKPFEKVLTVMVHGNPVTLEEFDTLLGKEIYMYRISTYMWHIKTHANGIVKTIKDGRKVVAYQIINPEEIKKYLDRTGVSKSNYVPGQIQKKPSTAKIANKSVTKLADLGAKPTKKTKQKVQPVTEEMEVTEITE